MIAMGPIKIARSSKFSLLKLRLLLGLIALGLPLFSTSLLAQEAKKSLLHLNVKGRKIIAEVVRTDQEKAKGLMFREQLGRDEGMLFVYGQEEILSFWMKNTRLPLSIAFIDKSGKIVDIQDMEPFSLQTHTSIRPAMYALEMNQGWFQRNGIGVGEVIIFPAPFRKQGEEGEKGKGQKK